MNKIFFTGSTCAVEYDNQDLVKFRKCLILHIDPGGIETCAVIYDGNVLEHFQSRKGFAKNPPLKMSLMTFIDIKILISM